MLNDVDIRYKLDSFEMASQILREKSIGLTKIVNQVHLDNKILKGNLEKYQNLSYKLEEELEDLNEEKEDLQELLDNLRNENLRLKQLLLTDSREIVLPYPPEESTDADYEDVKGHPEFEISRKYNYPIRKKLTEEEKRLNKKPNDPIKEYRSGKYIKVKLGKNSYFKHRIVAEQWIPKPQTEEELFVDHKNRFDTFDYRVENLRWVSKSENNRSRGGYNGANFIFFDYDSFDPKPALMLDYNHHSFKDYYYLDGQFYYDTGVDYRLINPYTRKTNSKEYAYVSVYDSRGNRVQVYIEKYKELLQNQK